MEEILASIRKIISEDSSDAQPAAPEVKAAPPQEADVLELTQEVHDEPVAAAPVLATAPVLTAAPSPAPASSTPEPEPEPAPAVAEEPAKADTDVVFQSIEEAPVSEPAVPLSQHEGIFSDKTRKALEDSFSNIHKPEEAVAPPAPGVAAPAQSPATDGATVQAVFEKAVRDGFDPVFHQWLGDNSDAMIERFKPLIREWMDAHFPALLEGAVRAEVERVARARH
jgi:cell pole-organizing protein PopZ